MTARQDGKLKKMHLERGYTARKNKIQLSYVYYFICSFIEFLLQNKYVIRQDTHA